MHTPHMMNVTLKTVAAQLWRNPEHLAQQETPQVYKLLLQIDWPWRQGWTRKELWQSLVHDGLDVNYETRPSLPSSPAPKSGIAQPRRTAGKAL